MLTPSQWMQFTSWWRQTAKRLGVDAQCDRSLAQEARCSTPEVDLSALLEGIAGAAGRLGGPDYTSVIKSLNSTPFRQVVHFRHNKKHSTEVWVVFLLKEHLRTVGLGKDRAW